MTKDSKLILPESSKGGSKPANIDRAAEGVIKDISTGYYGTWWIVRHPVKTILYLLGSVGAIATVICLFNFALGFTPGNSFGILKPIRADVGAWGSRAAEETKTGTDRARETVDQFREKDEEEEK